MKLFYRKYGSGPCMVILHGLYGSSDNWVTIARKLSEKYTIILPDLRNHGQSPHSDEHTYDLMSDDIFELITGLAVRRFILAGHSMGGRAAMKFALKWPDVLDTLIILDISPFGNNDPGNAYFRQHKEILETLLSFELKNLSSRSAIEKILAGKIDSEKTRGFLMKNLTRNKEGVFEWKLNLTSLFNNLENITGSVLADSDNRIFVSGFPVYFLRGERSNYLNPEDFPEIMKLFPAAELITIKNAGHWLHADQPDEIVKFLMGLS